MFVLSGSAYDVVSTFDDSLCPAGVQPPSRKQIDKYLSALNISMKLSASQNLAPIPGATLVLVDVSESNQHVPMSNKSQVCYMLGKCQLF